MSLVQPSGSDKLLHILCSPHIRTAVLRYAGTHRVRLHYVHSYTPFGFSLVSRATEIRLGKARRVGSIQQSPPELGILHLPISCADNRLVKSGIDCSLLPVCYTVCLCPPQEALVLISSLLPAAMLRSHDLLAKNANDWRSSVTSIFRFHCKMEELLITCPKFGDCLLSTLRFAVEDNTGRPCRQLHVISRGDPSPCFFGQISRKRLEVTNRLKKAAAG